MPIATPEVYAEMLGRAKENAYAFPAINCTSSETVNAAIKGFADAGSDGIIQFSTGGAEFASGLGVKDMVTGAVALAKFTHSIAAKYPINVALHTDHCPKDKLDTYVRPLLAISAERVAAGQESAVPVAHVGRLGGADRREPGNRPGAAQGSRGRQDHPRGRDRRGGRRRGRRRGRDRRQAVHHPGGLREDHRRAGPRRARQVPAGRDVRQRARRLQARQRQASPRHPGPGPEGGVGQARVWPTAPSRSTSSSTADRVR